MTFAQRLDSLMRERGWSNYRAAKEIGCHQTSVKNWLNGLEPTKLMLPQIANAFGVSVEYLTGQTDERGQIEKPATSEGDGLAERIKNLPPSFQKSLADFLRLAQADPKTAERHLLFAVQELQSAEQAR